MVSGALMPTHEPFLYTLSLTAMEGVTLESSKGGAVESSSACARQGSTDAEVARAKRQLRARLVFENDSVTNVAHQLGYFETVAGPEFHRRLARRSSAVTAGAGRRGAAKRLLPERGRSAGSSRSESTDERHRAERTVAGPPRPARTAPRRRRRKPRFRRR